METKSRPIGLVVVAVLMVLSGLVALVSSVPTLSQHVSTLQILLNVLFAGLMLYVSWGLVTLKPWAWMTAMVVQVLNGAFAAISLATVGLAAGGWIPLVIAVAVIVYLTRPHVRAAFVQLPRPTGGGLF